MKTRAGQKIRLTSVEELLGVANEESAMDLEIAKIRPFKDHPFKVLDDEKMQDLMESIRINGILSPVLVRPIGNDTYEMVSGHRRLHAAVMLGMDTVPAIIREMTDDEAVVKMVDANIQREELLPSEKAFAYKMKMDAMRLDEDLSETIAAYRTLIRENIGYDDLLIAHPHDRELVEGIADLILETVISRKEYLLIASSSYPAEVVRSKFLKL